MRVHIFSAGGNLYGFTRDAAGNNLPADRGRGDYSSPS